MGLARYATIVASGVLPRVLYAHARPPDPSWGSHYWPMSTSLLTRGVLGYEGVPSTHYEPLYPLFLAFARHVSGDDRSAVLVLQALLGSLGAVYLFALTSALTRDAITAAIAAAIFALYPYLVAQAAALEEVTLLTTLLVASAYHFVRTAEDRSAAHAVLCGSGFGLALLTRVTVAPAVLFAAAALLARRESRHAALVLGMAIALYLPYAARNHRLDGSLLPTRGGYNLLKANCKYSEAVIPAYMVDVMNGYVVGLAEHRFPDGGASEHDLDRFYAARALAFIRDDPAAFLRRTLRNVAYLLSPRLVPAHPIGPLTAVRLGERDLVVEGAVRRSWLEETAYSASYGPLLLAALVGAWRRRAEARRDVVLYGIVASFVIVYAVYAPATRVRAPMDFVIIFFAACALRALVPERSDASRRAA